MSHTDTRSVGELEAQIGALDASSPADLTADERARLVDALVALADAYGARGDFHAEADALSTLERLHAAHPTAEVDVHLATALANATAVRDRDGVYETSIQPDRIGEYRDRIAALYDDREVPAIAAPLARATAGAIHANAKAGRLDRISPLCEQLEAVYETHPEPDVAASLLTGYAHAERHLDPDDGEQRVEAGEPVDRLERAETLFETHPDADVAAGYAGVLAGRTNRDADRGVVEVIEERIARIEALAQGYPARESAIRGWLPMATANATRASFDAADVSRVDHWARQTAAHHEAIDTPTSATWLAVATFFAGRAAFFNGDIEAGESALERLRDLADTHENPVFDHWLGRAMFDAARAYVESNRGDHARSMADELASFAEGHQDQAAIESGLEGLYTHAPAMFDDPSFAPDEPESTGASDRAESVAVSDDTDPTVTVDGSAASDASITSSASARSGERDASAADLVERRAAGGTRPTTDSTESATDSTGTSATDTTDVGEPTTADIDQAINRDEIERNEIDRDEIDTFEDALDAAEAAADDDGGCGSCGDGGCGSCGTDTDLNDPASLPVIAAAVVGVVVAGVSVAYSLYRLGAYAVGRLREDTD